MRVLVFDIDGKHFGLDADSVREVLAAAALTQIPQAPPTIRGILDIRGTVVPVFDTRALLGLPSRPIRAADHFVISFAESKVIGLHVDHAVEIIEIDDSTVENAFSDGDVRLAGIARREGSLLPIHLIDEAALTREWSRTEHANATNAAAEAPGDA